MHNKYIKFLTITLFCVGLTKCQPDSVKDIDGNVYRTITIGTQVWMAENLKTTKYRNGDLIGTTTPATLVIEGESTPKYQWAYDGNESNVATYGRLYTWYVATDSRNVCPIGWHVPTDAEWTTLTDYLIKNGYGYGDGYKGMDIAKSMAATSGWVADETPEVQVTTRRVTIEAVLQPFRVVPVWKMETFMKWDILVTGGQLQKVDRHSCKV